MRRILVLITALSLIMSCAFASGMAESAGAPDPSRYEGPGYDSPEEAAKAYITAFGEKDIPAMLATFAIETYVDNLDREAQIERIRTFQLTFPDVYPNPGSYTGEALKAIRYGDLARVIAQQYIRYAWPEDRDPLGVNPNIFFKKDEDAGQFLKGFDGGWPGNVEFVMFADLAALPLYDKFASTNSLKNLATLTVIRGCDDTRDIVALIRIDGKDYAQFIECGKYGDKWYNITLQSQYANVLGIETLLGGLVPYDPSEYIDLG